MAVPLLHRCGHCGYESEISSSLSTFAENPFCRQCGLSASESDSKLQDELSSLINQHLTLSQPAIAEKQLSPAAPVTYITQHYHHSGHIATPSPQQLPDAERLSSLGIDATALSHAQIRLFSGAPPDQQERLIELWRIAPPAHAERNVGNWPQTSMEHEEEAARARYLKLTSPITLEGQHAAALTDYVQSHASHVSDYHSQPEPYMVHGYATPAANNEYNASLDPVYQHQNHHEHQSREWWARTQSQPMEHQYGALMQMREYFEEAKPPGQNANFAGSREEDMW